MKKKEFLDELSYLMELGDKKINESDSLSEFQGWDSLAAVSLIAFIHENFSVVIDAQALSRARKVEDLVAMVASHLEA